MYSEGEMMRVWMMTLLFWAALWANEEHKVVYDLTSGDLHTIEQKLLAGITYHKSYYEGKLQSLDVAVIIHGDAYKFFIKDLANSPYRNDKDLIGKQEELQKRLSSLVSMYDVELLMCQSGAKKRGLEKSVYRFVGFVPNAAIGLIDKQNEGYAYLPVN